MHRLTIALLALVTVSACAAPVETISKRPAIIPKAIQPQQASFAPPPAEQASIDEFARSFLNSIQTQSIQERREFCGFFFRDSAGQLQATAPRRGSFASCNMPVPQRRDNIVASYHTHGAYGPQYDNEVPSTTDLLSDFQLGVDGYVSTPGGRVWRVSNANRDTSQVCGLGCVIRDPGFVPRNENQVRQRYTVATLTQRSGV